MKNNQNRQEQKFLINFDKEAKEGENKLISTIDRHLRYLMLFHAFDKISNEVTDDDNSLQIDKSSNTVKSRVIIGNIVDIELGMKFFAENDQVEDADLAFGSKNEELIKPKIFK